MKEFVKSKKGKIVIAVIALLILIGIVYSCSSEKNDKKTADIAAELEKDEDGKTEQNNLENTVNGLEVGESLSESEDTLSVSGGETKEDTDNSSTSPKDESQNDESTKEGENTKDDTEPESDNTASEQTFGELY